MTTVALKRTVERVGQVVNKIHENEKVVIARELLKLSACIALPFLIISASHG